MIELKRGKTPREVVAQVVDYASRGEQLEGQEIARIYSRYSAGESLDEAFAARLSDPSLHILKVQRPHKRSKDQARSATDWAIAKPRVAGPLCTSFLPTMAGAFEPTKHRRCESSSRALRQSYRRKLVRA